MIVRLKKIFSDETEAKERKKEWEKLFLRCGLEKFEGHRQKTADYLGISVRGLRLLLNKHIELKEEFPTFKEEVSSFYHMLGKDDYPWLASKKEKYTKMKLEVEDAKRREKMKEL